MVDSKNFFVKPLMNSSHVHLWKVRVRTLCSTKRCREALTKTTRANSSGETRKKPRLASIIIVLALSDGALQIVHTTEGDLAQMQETLDARYDSIIEASKITKMTDLNRMK